MRGVVSLDPSVFVHPGALCESEEVGSGTRNWAFAHVVPGAVARDDSNICDHAFIEGGAYLGDRVVIKNGVLIGDRVRADEGLSIIEASS